MILLVCAEGEQMEEYDDTTSPNDQSISRIFGSDFDPNYSLSAYPYSDSSDSNISSLHEGNFCVLNGT